MLAVPPTPVVGDKALRLRVAELERKQQEIVNAHHDQRDGESSANMELSREQEQELSSIKAKLSAAETKASASSEAAKMAEELAEERGKAGHSR